MLIDFNSMEEACIENMNGGDGQVSARMFAGEGFRAAYCRIRPGSSIGKHLQKDSIDINFVVSGRGVAVCDGKEEPLVPGTCHICPSGSEHSIRNIGDEDLVIMTFVQYFVKRYSSQGSSSPPRCRLL